MPSVLTCPINSDLLNLRVFNYPAAPLHDDLCFLLILLIVCAQSLMQQCSITVLGFWTFNFPYSYPLGKPLLYIADHEDIFTEHSNPVSYLLFSKQHDQRCQKDFTEPFNYGIPKPHGHFHPMMTSQGGFPCSRGSSIMVARSIAAFKRALLSNHCCPAESLLCPQFHPYALLLNYPG